MKTEGLYVVRSRAAGLDVHKMEITATVRLCFGPHRGRPPLVSAAPTLATSANSVTSGLERHRAALARICFTAKKFMSVTDRANAAYGKEPKRYVKTISKTAGMDLVATENMLGMFSFPSAGDQKSKVWLGGTVQRFTKVVADFFIKQGQLDKALDSYDFAIYDSYL